MTPGLPGTGIGGLFYILSAAWMPLREALRGRGGDAVPGRWALIARQFAIAVGIIVAMTSVFWAIDASFPASVAAGDAEAAAVASSTGARLSLRVPVFLGTIGVLVAVLTAVQILRLTATRPKLQ